MIKENLRSLYMKSVPRLFDEIRNHPDIVSAEYDSYGGPFLMSCPWEEQYKTSKLKLLVVGKETNRWIPMDRAIESPTAVDDLMRNYEEFKLGLKYIDRAFWMFCHFLQSQINGTEASLSFLWTNVWKFDRVHNCHTDKKKWVGPPEQTMRNIILENFNVLPIEIEICKPDVVVFFTGPNYDANIKLMFPDIEKHQVDNQTPNKIVRFSSSNLPKKTYRTYHPNYSVRQRYIKNESKNVLQSLFDEISQA